MCKDRKEGLIYSFFVLAGHHIDTVLGSLHFSFIVLLLENLDFVLKQTIIVRKCWELNFDITYGRGSNPGKHNRQEEETVESAEDDDHEIHAEVVQLEKSGWSEGEYKDTKELG